jgi:hypothetical protein
LAKLTGLGWSVASLDDAGGTPVAMVGDITDLQFATPRAVQDVTGLDKSAYERLLLLADFTCTPKGVFNTALSHSALKTVTSSTTIRTWTLTVAGATLANEVIVTDYQLARSATGELTWQAPMSLASGIVPAWV